jgi:hypothetical protein
MILQKMSWDDTMTTAELIKILRDKFGFTDIDSIPYKGTRKKYLIDKLNGLARVTPTAAHIAMVHSTRATSVELAKKPEPQPAEKKQRTPEIKLMELFLNYKEGYYEGYFDDERYWSETDIVNKAFEAGYSLLTDADKQKLIKRGFINLDDEKKSIEDFLKEKSLYWRNASKPYLEIRGIAEKEGWSYDSYEKYKRERKPLYEEALGNFLIEKGVSPTLVDKMTAEDMDAYMNERGWTYS